MQRTAGNIYAHRYLSSPPAASQDLLALSDKYNGRPVAEETINDPTVRKHYWRYRCHKDLETLLEDKAFLLDLQHMLLGDH